jgi:hypothetical protein
LGGAALSTHFGLQQVFVMAMPVAILAFLCAMQLRAQSKLIAATGNTE